MLRKLWIWTRWLPGVGERRSSGVRYLLVGLLASSAVLASVMTLRSQANPQAAETTDPKPENAVPAILSLFDTYQVVGMSVGHGMKDMDDFILMLIRNPEFPKVVNDIVVECGNALYQPILDRYIAGEDVPFSEARQAWRNSTGIMCDVSGFFEQLFPLVRRINQRLLPTKRLRVVAAGPPVDWNAIKKESDVTPFLGQSLDENYAAVMEREVFAKQRKALMLFGNGHLSHGVEMPPAALADFAIPQGTVARYERSHPGVTFVIDQFDARPGPCGTPGSMDSTEFQVKMQAWPVPSLVRTKGTSLPGATIALGGKVTVLIDAFLYLGPRDLALAEPSPADIFLDTEFMAEVHRRAALTGWLTKKQETPLAIPWSIDPDEVHEESASPFILCRQR